MWIHVMLDQMVIARIFYYPSEADCGNTWLGPVGRHLVFASTSQDRNVAEHFIGSIETKSVFLSWEASGGGPRPK